MLRVPALNGVFVGIVLFSHVLLAPSSHAQPIADSDLSDLNLDNIDRTIAEIASEIARLKNGIDDSGPSTATVTEAAPGQEATQAALTTSRSRANAYCFQDTLTGHSNERELDVYFDEIEVMVSRLNTTIVAFDNLKPNHAEGACPSYMLDMLASMDQQISTVSRRDLSDLVFHLESCWPDDGMKEADGSELDMDSRYTRARGSLQLYGRAQRALREATAWCG